MKHLAKFAAVILLPVLATPAIAQNSLEEQRKQEDKRAIALATETIPKLIFKNIPAYEALEQIKDEWRKHHPDLSLPIINHSRSLAAGLEYDNVSMELHDVPYIIALRYICAQRGSVLRCRGDYLEVKDYDPSERDSRGWTTLQCYFSPNTMKILGIDPDAKMADATQAFAKFGVEFAKEMRVLALPANEEVLVYADDEQQQQVAGIILLLNKGFKISKEESPATK